MVEGVFRVNLIVTGRVQGVFYRASTMEQAQQLGLVGFVMNLPGRTVEIVVEGQRHAIETLVEWCGRGPSDALVEGVEVRWQEPTGEFKTFVIR